MSIDLKNGVLKASVRMAAKSLRRYRPERLLIIMYHRFRADDDKGYVLKQSDFRKQLAYITRNFTVVALEDYLSLSPPSRKRMKNPAALTVDDGYRNFYRYAFPVLQQFSLPATVYVPVNFIEQGGWMWQDRNKYVLVNAGKKTFSLECHGVAYRFETGAFEALMKSMETAYALSMSLPLDMREDFSNTLAQAAGVSLPEKPVAEFEPLSWDDLREMEKHGIHIGSHTMNHEILTRVESERLAHELRNSRQILEDRLGHQVQGFCYPNGDYNTAVVKAVEESGYRYAVTTQGGLNEVSTPLMRLKREAAPEDANPASIEHCCYVSPLRNQIVTSLEKCRGKAIGGFLWTGMHWL